MISPYSVKSSWCQKELALAETQGIKEKRVKVLPVKLGDVEMPAFLEDAIWGDATDPASLASDLAHAIKTHLQRAGVEMEAQPVAVSVSPEPTRAVDPVRAAGLLDQIADRVDELLIQWDRCQRQGGLTDDLIAEQRRLRTLLSRVTPAVEQALPLVSEIANASWQDHFHVQSSADAEPDLREELRVVRSQISAGLPVVPRWRIEGESEQVSAGNRDAVAYRWSLARGTESRKVTVFVSGTALESADAGLPGEVVEAKNSVGRTVIQRLLSLQEPPPQVLVTTDGIRWELP